MSENDTLNMFSFIIRNKNKIQNSWGKKEKDFKEISVATKDLFT